MTISYSLGEIAEYIDGELVGDSHQLIRSIASLPEAGGSDISFIASPAYQKFLATSQAGAVILTADQAQHFAGNKLISTNPYLAYARLTSLFDKSYSVDHTIHPSAVIGKDVELGTGVSIGANAVIGDRVTLNDGVVIGPCCVVGNDTVLGTNTRLMANVTLYHGIAVGSDCIIHSGAVIGADGFGFAPNGKEWVKIHQLGSVTIGNRVEIGACSTIDRGALDNTVIADGVIIDNLVHIAHNVKIGKNTAMAATCGISGSVVIGENCTFSGGVGLVGHIELTNNVHITGMTMVTNSITEPGSYSSGTPMSPTKEWRKNAVRFRQLDTLATRLNRLEKTLKNE